MLIRRILPAVIALLMLRLSMRSYSVPMDEAYVVLFIVAGLLAFILYPFRAADEFHIDESFWRKAVSTVLSWASLFAILLFLACATKSSAIYFSMRNGC